GTQRLTRKLYERQGEDGIRVALDMMISGRSVDVERALAQRAGRRPGPFLPLVQRRPHQCLLQRN
ncbi:MAG: hypothetical protein AAF552_10540, partial [Pseudomonadota bacterium]